MARPQSSNKAKKQRAGSGSAGKRKLASAPVAGGATGRPTKQRRREGRSKPIPSDIYEAEDSDPDEVKHAERFDQVDNYEYELPSDFEDEEIDEDLAFTEEDKKKFGAWFEKEVSADGDDDGDDDNDGLLGVGDDDGDAWDGAEDDDDAGGDDDEEEDEGDRKGRRARPSDEDDDPKADGDDLDDLFLDDDFQADEEEDNEELQSEEEEDDERHRAMLREVLGGADGRKRARRDPNAAVVSEAYPESEYNLNPGAASAGGVAGSLSIADLLQGLTAEERRKLGHSRKLLEKVAGKLGGGGQVKGGLKPVAVPLPSIVAERQERKAGYEAAAEEVTKWQPLVKANREVPTLKLVSGRENIKRVTTTAALVAQHTPSADNALEAEVAALLEKAGAANTEALEEAEEKLALKALSMEEARERRERLAKLRSLLFYHELKARRLKAIKSKEYHRHLAKAAKRKATKLAAAAAESQAAGGGDVDAEKVEAIEAEFQRAKERLTLRHRNSSRWARRALKRGQLQIDAGTKAAIADQLQLGQELKRKIEGRKGSGSDEDSDSDGSTSASDGEDGGNGEGGSGARDGKGSARVRSAALELLAGGELMDLTGDNVPKKGLLALPFMKRAMERRRLEAQQQAQEMLRDLDEQEVLREQAESAEEGAERGGAGAGDSAEAGGSWRGEAEGGRRSVLEALVGYGVPAAAATGLAGRKRFGGGAGDSAGDGDAEGRDVDSDDYSDVASDDMEDAGAKAERLGRKTREAKQQQQKKQQQQEQQQKQQQKLKGKKGGKGQAEPPSAADQADLDAVLAAGAAGRGLLVASSDAGLDAPVAAPAAAAAEDEEDMDDKDADAAAERRESSRGASTSHGAAGSQQGKRGVLADVARQQASITAGGGRAALFETGSGKAAGGAAKGKASAGGAAAAAGSADGNGAAAEGSKKFVSCKAFSGPRPGYCFKRGPQGLGYYLDPKQPHAAAKVPATGSGPPGGKQQQGKGGNKGKQSANGSLDGGGEKGAPGVTVSGKKAQTAEAASVEGNGTAARNAKRQRGAGAAGAAAEVAAAEADGGPAAANSDEEEEADAAPMMRPSTGSQQRDLIRQAFAGDDVEAEFAADKAAAVAGEMPNIEEPSALPGWGAWSAQQRNPKWMQAAKEKVAKQRADAAAGRKDVKMKYVVITEKWDKKASKYTTPQAPFPFTSQEAYERSLRQPLGREYNPDTAFRDLTRPAVLKQAGAVIAPLKYSENTAKELWRKGAKAAKQREARTVMTVAGGAVRTGKR